ncbi:Fic family protein [Halobacteriovorax sp. RZ-1]|uniref:Fic family protein n=1 Tax=unclassified Halobacteriovorax TaxID=2639665 RepID=UPI00371B3169
MGTFKRCSVCSKLDKNAPDWLSAMCSYESRGRLKPCQYRFDSGHLEQLIETGRSFSNDEIISLSSQLHLNAGYVKRKVRNGEFTFPNNADEFISLIQIIHTELFSGTGIETEGTFRTDDVYFGTNHNNMREENQIKAVDASDIDFELRNCWDNILEKLSSENYLEKVSLFFPRFFRIHPFQDGNGRTARIFVDILLAQYFKVFNYDDQKKYRRQYIKALSYAHRAVRKRGLGEVRSVWLMKKFLKKFINDVVPTENLIEEEN